MLIREYFLAFWVEQKKMENKKFIKLCFFIFIRDVIKIMILFFETKSSFYGYIVFPSGSNRAEQTVSLLETFDSCALGMSVTFDL